MPLDFAWDKAVEQLRELSPYVIAGRSGVSFTANRFELPFFHRLFFIFYPEIRVEEAGEQTPPPRWLQLILLHYLLTADGTPVADRWITYRYLPGAYLFEGRFQSMAIQPLVRAFGQDIEGFKRACLSLGGVPMSRTGDAAFRFLALPCIPVACILYLGDEEVAPSVNILFDSAASHYLPTEDLSYLGSYLSLELQRRRMA
jgi:hypothetical protein